MKKWAIYCLVVVVITAMTIFLRVQFHEFVRAVWLPGFFKWRDVQPKMYLVYFVAFALSLAIGTALLRKFRNSKVMVSFVLYLLWLACPTYVKWHVAPIDDYMAGYVEHVMVVVPMVLAVEYLFPIHISFVMVWLSTLVYFFVVKGFLQTERGRDFRALETLELLQLVVCFMVMLLVLLGSFMAWIFLGSFFR